MDPIDYHGRQPTRHSEDTLHTLHSANIATQISCIVLITPLVFSKFLVRRWLRQRFDVSDVSCFLAWVFLMGYCACGLTYAYVSDGRDLSTLPSNDSQAILKISYIASILYCPHVLAARISLLYILIKIFWPFRRIIATYVLIALNVLYYIIIVFIKAFTCRPPSAYWAPEDRSGGACMSRRDILMADSVVSMVSDLAVALLPIVYMWSSHLPVKDKLKVFGTLGIGGIAIAFSIYRLVIIAIDVVFTQHDTSVFVKTLMCGNAEGGIGIICACIPTFSAFTLQKRRNRSPFHSQEEARYINSSSSWNPSCYTPDRQTSQITSSAGRSSTDSVVNTTMQDQEESDSGPGSRPCGQWLIYRQVSLHQDCTAVSHCHEAMP